MTNVSTNLFFVFGLLNSAGETFSGKKSYSSIIDGGKKGQAFYKGLGFTNTTMATCHGVALIKDSNGRLLSFVAPISHTSKKNCTLKEYNMTYWAWSEVKRQAETIAEKAAAKSSTKVDVEESEVFIRPEGQNKNFYGVITPEFEGFVLTWAQCEALVKGKSSKYKGFNGLEQAKVWMRENNAADAYFENVTDIKQIK